MTDLDASAQIAPERTKRETVEAVGTLVIGAGPSGLAVAGELKRLGVDHLLIDAAPEVASSWRRHYRRLHLHTEGRLSTLPGSPAPREWSTYPSREAVVAYLEGHAARMGLEPRLGLRVCEITQCAAEARHAPRYRVRCDGGVTFEARDVVVATGYNRVPNVPSWPGLDAFPGRVLHTSAYVDGAPFAGQRVLVVGAGNSAGEIAVDLWEHGATVAMTIRGPIHVVPRDVFGMSTQRIAIAMAHLPAHVADALSGGLRQAIIGDLRPWGIVTPSKGPMALLESEGRVPLMDAGVVALIRQGAVTVFPGIATIDGAVVQFADGRRDTFDAIVLGTGYRAGLETIIGPIPGALNARGLPDAHGEEGAPGLWFCGFRNPRTGALRESAREATRIARAIAARM